MGQHTVAWFGQRYALGAALKQVDAEVAFEIPDLAAQRRLRDVQGLGGPAKV